MKEKQFDYLYNIRTGEQIKNDGSVPKKRLDNLRGSLKKSAKTWAWNHEEIEVPKEVAIAMLKEEAKRFTAKQAEFDLINSENERLKKMLADKTGVKKGRPFAAKQDVKQKVVNPQEKDENPFN